MNISLGENYLICCNNVDNVKDKVVDILESKNIDAVYDYDSLSNEALITNMIPTPVAILIPNFAEVNLLEFDKILRIASKGIKGLSIIGICEKNKLEYLELNSFNKVYL